MAVLGWELGVADAGGVPPPNPPPPCIWLGGVPNYFSQILVVETAFRNTSILARLESYYSYAKNLKKASSKTVLNVTDYFSRNFESVLFLRQIS